MLPTDAFSMRIGTMRQSLIRKVFDCKKSTSINLGLGQPSESVPAEIIDEGMRRLKQGDMGYTANAGMLSLRDIIARSHNLPFAGSAENVVVTCGAQEGILAAMAACLDAGDSDCRRSGVSRLRPWRLNFSVHASLRRRVLS